MQKRVAPVSRAWPAAAEHLVDVQQPLGVDAASRSATICGQ